MNVLHIAAHLGAGAGNAIGGLAIADKANSHKIVILCEPQKRNHIERCLNNNVEIISLGLAGFDLEWFEWADAIIYNWWGHPAFDAFIEKYPVNREKSVLWSHVNGVFPPKFNESLTARFDYFMVTSELSFQSGVFEKKNCELVYGFGDFCVDKIAPKQTYSFNNNGIVIGFVGSPGYQKLSADFVECCDCIIKHVPGARFVLVGEIEKALWDDICKAKIEDYFIVIGWVENVYDHLISFDVFGYPMNAETFATTENVILEALACGLPTVISRYPLGKYQLTDGVSGYLFDSPEEYAEIIYKLANDAALREKIGHNAREYAAEKYSLAENITSFNKVIERVMQHYELKENVK